MTRENAEALRVLYGRWGSGDFSAGEDLFDPGIVFVLGAGFPDAGTYRGLDEIREYTRGFLEPWSRIAIEAEEISAAGDRIVARVRQHGVGGGSGAPTEFAYFQVWTFDAGKVVRLENFRERSDALAAAGLAGP